MRSCLSGLGPRHGALGRRLVPRAPQLLDVALPGLPGPQLAVGAVALFLTVVGRPANTVLWKLSNPGGSY